MNEEVASVDKHKQFVDKQIQGPFHTWHHVHFFKEVENGVEMEDIITYKLPFGLLGNLLLSWYIKRKVKQIFAHRMQVLNNYNWLAV